MTTYTSLRTGMICRHSDGACIPPDPANRDYAEFLAAIAADPACVAEEPAPPLTEAACIAAIQQRLDAHAQSWGYDSALSAASYATSTVPRFAAEAAAIIGWRDAIWATGYTVLAEVRAGTRNITTLADLLALLPDPPNQPKV